MGNLGGTPANLGLLQNNGGPTNTHALMAGPGIDGADPASTVAVDQRGFGRPGANGSRDMGAYESDGSSPSFNLDFNNDGNYDCGDMNLLEAAIDAGMPVATFDVNDDGMLTSADVTAWLMDAGEVRFGAGRFFKPGDATLDGSVDGSDFGVWNSNKFTPANRWCQGDFNQDNSVDGSDFGVWNSNKFTSSDAGRTASASVMPERSRPRLPKGGETMVSAIGIEGPAISLAFPARMEAPIPALRAVQAVPPADAGHAVGHSTLVEARRVTMEHASRTGPSRAEAARDAVFSSLKKLDAFA